MPCKNAGIFGGTMTSKSEKKYRQIKRTHIGVSIFEFILFSIVSSVMLVYACQQFTSYIIDTKLSSEYDSISYLAKLYEAASAANDENIYALLDGEAHDYIVVGADGKVIREKGVNSCSYEEGGRLFLTDQDKVVTAYRDTDRDYVYPGKNERIHLDFLHFREWMQSDRDEVEKSLELNGSVDRFINLPIWLSVDVNGGSEQFIGKAVFYANRRDVILITSSIAALIVLMAVILITMLVSAIKNVIRQRNMLDLFFNDLVTGGHNWTWFLVMGERALKKRRNAKFRFAVASLILLNYRNYCVCHSLKAGEKLLCRIYTQINATLGKKEMCAHTNAANFALMLKYTDEEELRERLNELIKGLEVIDTEHKFSFQAGVSLLDRSAEHDKKTAGYKNVDLDTAYNNASAARMSLEDSGDSGVAFFDEKLREEQEWLDKVQERQQRALDNEEFMVYYQPKYDPKTDQIRGAEALIRWKSPEFGIVPPGRFIPIFEKNGFITTVDHYMIRHVAEDQKRWLDMGYHCVPVSVNVSRAHFVENDLADQIKEMVDKTGTPHELIEIELTESAFFDDKKAMINTISRLKDFGFAVSMDDFGSGYSSLNSLKDMPLDVLKLDAEFFRGDSEDGRGEIVVSEAIHLGKLLNMKIVAEGVEVKEQVDFLANEDCDMIQGYYYAKPMPAEEFEERIRQ